MPDTSVQRLTRRAVASTSHSKEERGESVSRSPCWVIRIWPFGRSGLEVKGRLAVVPAINPQPHVRETKSQLVLTLQFREIKRAGPECLRHDVVVIPAIRAKPGIIPTTTK